MNDYSIILIGTIPPPIGGDAIWAQSFIKYCEKNNKKIFLVNTSLIGKRSKDASSKKNLFTELIRARRIAIDLKEKIKHLKGHSNIVCHFNINCSKLGTIRDFFISKILIKNKIPFCIHCHCDVKDQIGCSKIGIKYLKKIMNRAHCVYVLNKKSLSYLHELNISKAKIIPNAISINHVAQVSKTINKKELSFLFVGHLKKEKGVIEILNSASQFPQHQFVFVGPDSDNIFSKSSNLSKNIVYLGEINHEEIYKIYDKFDIFLFPSYSEGFSVSLLEAMSRGMPIICSNVGSNSEMIGCDGGILLDKISSNCIIDSIRKIQNFDLNRASNSNIERVKNNYIEESVFREILNDYCKCFI